MNMKKKLILAFVALLPLAAFAEEDKDTTVVIPETGHLAVKPSRNFSGPAGIIISSFYGSGNATSTGLKFNNQELGEGIIIYSPGNSSSGYILTGKPGTYTLTMTDKTATKQFFSTSASWAATPGQVTKKDCRIYKFVNQVGKIGFERDEKYASVDYLYCDMAEGDYIYFGISVKAMERITATMGTSAEALAFIPWDAEKWGCPMPSTSGISEMVNGQSVNGPSYNLKGQRVEQPQKGIYIKNGKKYIAK